MNSENTKINSIEHMSDRKFMINNIQPQINREEKLKRQKEIMKKLYSVFSKYM